MASLNEKCRNNSPSRQYALFLHIIIQHGASAQEKLALHC